MSQKNYKEVIDELKTLGYKPVVIKDKGGNEEGDFYVFDGLRLDNLFHEFFLFGQAYLDGPRFSPGKKPARLFFNEIRSVNACAGLYKNYSIIEIFRGAFIDTYDFFVSKNDFLKKEKFRNYRDYTDNNIGYFLFQFVMLYFFYHEVGHLIQLSPGDKTHFEFATEQNAEIDIMTSHAKEFDADWYSATQLAQHILEYARGKFDHAENVSQTTVEIAGLALGGIYTFYLWRSLHASEFYTEKGTHPHPLVRLRYLVEFIFENLHANIPEGISLDNLIKSSLAATDSLMSEHQASNLKINKMFLEKMSEINAHVEQIKAHVPSLDFLCINRMTNN